MNDDEQLRWLDEQQVEYGLCRPREMVIRDLARQAVLEEYTFTSLGTRIPVKRRTWTLGERGYFTIAVSLHPAFRGIGMFDYALLMAERIIRDQWED